VLEQIDTIDRLRETLARRPLKGSDPIIGLVPTMGALHAGHLALIRTARAQCDIVVVSIFVNPLQFDRPDDLARYPKTLDADLSMCRELGVDVAFSPASEEMYPQRPECTIDVGRLADHLCGRFRPGHFQGVATVVLKLFQIVQPEYAYFGEKDAQQLAIIRQLVADFNVPVEIVEVPTVREADGLAISSRNRHLTDDQRALAIHLFHALGEVRRRITMGERQPAEIKNAAAGLIPQSEALRLEYLEIVDPGTMQPVEKIDGSVRVAGALWVGSTRLIDNLLFK
jgi:pantoate--beta-alanine ligase